MSLTEAEWREAFRRCAIIADWPSTLTRPVGRGADGVGWCAEAPQFDIDANARAILDDSEVERWNDCLSRFLREALFRKEPEDEAARG